MCNCYQAGISGISSIALFTPCPPSEFRSSTQSRDCKPPILYQWNPSHKGASSIEKSCNEIILAGWPQASSIVEVRWKFQTSCTTWKKA